MTPPPAQRTREMPVTVRVFSQQFSSTPRGARLARCLALHELHAWGVPPGSDTSDAAALVLAELTANAVTHGRVPGRNFELVVSLTADVLRIEVSDTRGECRPPAPALRSGPGTGPARPDPLADTGRGLLLVQAVATRWEVRDRPPVGKTIAAELALRT
ncbi:ATP-binding protein [Streptomyces sp. NPDC059650]|uniref:ATP-binding protein n=1 Tax=Streptomyces sp. NPDC059650 TaxID=3346896 RepID=UPI0036A020CE